MKYCLKIRITDFLVYICTMCARVRLCVWHWQERDHPTFFTIPWPSHSLLEWVEVKAVFGDDPELLTFLSLFTREVVGWCVCERTRLKMLFRSKTAIRVHLQYFLRQCYYFKHCVLYTYLCYCTCNKKRRRRKSDFCWDTKCFLKQQRS